MFLLIIFLSYIIGCGSTIAFLIYLYILYGLDSTETIVEQEQYQTFHSIPENDHAKNSTVDAVNYLCQFLFQELRDTSKFRRYITKKINFEIRQIRNTQLGKLLIQDILIQSFTMGKECPIFSDIQLERQERQERADQNEPQLIKEFVAKLNVDYKEGFSVILDIMLRFGYKCQIFIKIKRIQGELRLEFRHEPFSHWLFVFQNEPFIDFEVKSYLSNYESIHLAQILNKQIRRTIRRKQTWPSYKIRYRPFFPTSEQTLPTEVLSNRNQNLIPGVFDITIKHCDRLSIPFEIFPPDKHSLLSVFLTININENMCRDYLHIDRDQWPNKEFEFRPNSYRLNIKEVLYMDRTEFLIDEFDPIPDGIEDKTSFKAALEDKNLFLLQIQGQDVKSSYEINRFLKRQSSIEYDQKLKFLVGIPLLHSVQARRIASDERATNLDTQNEQTSEVKPSSKSIEQVDEITVIMMNTECLQEFNAQRTPTQKAQSNIEFNHDVKFPAKSNDKFLNLCLWCIPPLDCDVPDAGKQYILLGYATVPLSELVLDAHMSFKRETQKTLNFRSVYSSKSKLKSSIELSSHKGYDDNMTHGFVTINIRHQPQIERRSHQEEKKEPIVLYEKDDDQLVLINEEHDLPSSGSTDHSFEDLTFSVGTVCAFCHTKIWIKSGRQCRKCLVTIHKKCEDKFNGSICTQESVQVKSPGNEDSYSLISNDDNDSQIPSIRSSTKNSSASDSSIRRSFRGFRSKNNNQTPLLTVSDCSKPDENDVKSSPSLEKKRLSTSPVQTSSKLVNAASSAYSKFRDFKTRRQRSILVEDTKKSQLISDLGINENITEDDIQDIIEKCLSDETIDIKSLEELFREKSIDHTALYKKVNELGTELYGDLTLEERKQKFQTEISRLKQDLDLQGQIRDEIIVEYNNELTDDSNKKKIQEKLDNMKEKIQALHTLTLFFCSGLIHCRSQIKANGDNHPNDSSDEQ